MTVVMRSLLFTPANRPQAFDKALAIGADCVCLDLEDAVPPDAKDGARAPAIAFLTGAGGAGATRALRINALSSAAGARDLAGLADAAPRAGLVMLPKVTSAAELRMVASILDEVNSETGLIALVETADGLSAVEEIARASPRLRALVFGGVDLSAELGAAPGSDTMRMARARIVHAARAGGCDVLDVPELDFRNAEKVDTAAADAAANGFTGKAAIHPSNIATINAAFTPTADEIARAQAAVAAFEAAPSGLVVIDGKLIEAPVIKGMRKLLAIAKAAGVL
ncbi:citrate lyase subunit beta / citryl-CoA lyase/(S)-citramalyl-CoA lyase [Jannaschia faecimaris]|uniref:Citrate lyase subunit beta / citryl-CoA lyase/(S)-citramalyl-CoA lyase n=1 Tax=Jannaschia faecimaris TaxID=1244108 RepID=A0A1H3U9T0_9RHOB|nr:CoA ester lyase [Jannaschia faecimaris]SDZ59223.1 citrate lyase subunit beta / citryl-CoA lyase/(S)-citramalyl-CoA lyase [Jannaschia faecimaris]